jgi:hypothetical protein
MRTLTGGRIDREVRRLRTSELYFWELSARQRAARRVRQGEALVVFAILCAVAGALLDALGHSADGVVLWAIGYPAAIVGFRRAEHGERTLRCRR